MANSKPGSGKPGPGKPESRLIKAAGAVAWRPGPNGRPEILLVHRRKYDDWSLPKGKVEPGEPLAVTAVREVLEEGGARLALGRRLSSVRYNVGGRPKRVHYWSAAVTSVDDRGVPNDEVDRVVWVDVDHAAERISYNRDNAVVADFARLSADTVPLIFLRHAKAVAKPSWKKADERRPLDDAGRADAKALAELLACFGPTARLITSPAARCVETLRPFAERSGVELREEPSLYIHNQSSRTVPADSPTSVTALVSDAIAAGEPAIFCAHRENIPLLQAAALAALGLAPPASDAAPGSLLAQSLLGDPGLPQEWDDPLPTSGFWVLNLAPPPAPDPAAPAPTTPTTPSHAPTLASPKPSASPAPAAPSLPPPWRRWLRLRPRAHRPSAATQAEPPATSVATPAPELLSAPVAATVAPETTTSLEPADASPAPPSRLVSADRYDLTEFLQAQSMPLTLTLPLT
jgi:8-oxo-(d)GTP phosphatase